MASCTGIACYLLSNWTIGTIITVTTKSGQIIGPATLSNFYPTLCLVILKEEDIITPESTNIIFIGCEDIESVTLTV